MKIKLIVATRMSEQEFFQKSATGTSARRTPHPDLELRLAPNNRMGLPKVYNWIIKQSVNDPAILVFAHDDIHLLDYFWCHRIVEGLQQFPILGVAGNKSRSDQQTIWVDRDEKGNMVLDNLSGIVGHGKKFPPENITYYGPPRQQVKLLDGVLLAAHSDTLISNDLYFDESFDFHFYDLDFCRQAEEKQIACGTWDIALMHESGGNYASAAWQEGRRKYLNKWGR